jgi:hypothetical protein
MRLRNLHPQLHGDNFDAGLRCCCSFLRSGSPIITAAVQNASAAWEYWSCSGSFAQAAEFLIHLMAVMLQRLDAALALLGVKEALTEDGPRRLDAQLDLELRHHPHPGGQATPPALAPGKFVDHIVPFKRGGAGAAENMQWQMSDP